mgnify:CR=1 FL=1
MASTAKSRLRGLGGRPATRPPALMAAQGVSEQEQQLEAWNKELRDSASKGLWQDKHAPQK